MKNVAQRAPLAGLIGSTEKTCICAGLWEQGKIGEAFLGIGPPRIAVLHPDCFSIRSKPIVNLRDSVSRGVLISLLTSVVTLAQVFRKSDGAQALPLLVAGMISPQF